MPVAGSNGIFDHRDAIEFIMAGAGVVQIGSVLMIKGIKWLTKVIEGMERFMDEKGYDDIRAMHGIASARAAGDYSEQFARARRHAVIDHGACKNPSCTVCIQMCFYEALSQSNDGVVMHPESCIGCELCYDVCPFDAIAMAETTPAQYAEGYYDIPEGIFETDKFTTRRNNPESIKG